MYVKTKKKLSFKSKEKNHSINKNAAASQNCKKKQL